MAKVLFFANLTTFFDIGTLDIPLLFHHLSQGISDTILSTLAIKVFMTLPLPGDLTTMLKDHFDQRRGEWTDG